MDKVIIAFLRKEPFATKTANTDGYKLFFGDTCVGQWKEHRVLITNTIYEKKDIDRFTLALIRWAKKSDLIYQLTTKLVPWEAKELKSYE